MSAFTVTIRPDYVELCEGDHCAAAILDLFQRWHFGKQRKQATPWIYKKRTELVGDMLGLFGLNRVAGALLKLRKWGYLLSRSNPLNGQDKTLQYLFNEAAVNEALNALNQALNVTVEGVERLNLNVEKSNSAPSSLTESLADSLTETHKSDKQQQPRARDVQPVTAAVVVEPVEHDSGEFLETNPERADVQDDADRREPAAPSPDCAAPLPADLPLLPGLTPKTAAGLVERYGSGRVRAVIEYARQAKNLQSPAGFVIRELERDKLGLGEYAASEAHSWGVDMDESDHILAARLARAQAVNR